MTMILDRINSPADLKGLDPEELNKLADDLRAEMVKVISLNGGHLASSLGVVELTIAIHRTFNCPDDQVIWDVGHQSYAHKLITGRRERFSTIRQLGGLSGFPSRSESPYDAFTTGHAGTSISAALGMALARDLDHSNYHVIAVIGDGSLGAGLSFEAINHAGNLGKRLIVILNDNGMAISPGVGALSRLLKQVKLHSKYPYAKKKMKAAFDFLPFGKSAWMFSRQMKKSVERTILPNAFWEQLGFNYLGPIDGHNIREIETALRRAGEIDSKPTLVHVLTKKGKGYTAAENDVIRYHGISPSSIIKSTIPSYSHFFGEAVSKLMRANERVVAISAAMLDGTGLAEVAREFPDRTFDVGICEQHAVTMAAGMATKGFIPIVAIYSTFLQRAYDQVVQDVCLQNLPVIFAVDRAGIVGEDGKTHQGPFDLSYLRCIPNMILASPADENELQHLLYTAVNSNQPFAIRFPRGNGQGVELSSDLRELPPGKAEIVREGKDLSILAIGPAVYDALDAAEMLMREGLDCAVVNARYVKPLDAGLILEQAEKTHNLVTVEENTLYGGFASSVMDILRDEGDLSAQKIRCLGLPDIFIEHGPSDLFRSRFGIDTDGIAACVRNSFSELFSESSVELRNRK